MAIGLGKGQSLIRKVSIKTWLCSEESIVRTIQIHVQCPVTHGQYIAQVYQSVGRDEAEPGISPHLGKIKSKFQENEWIKYLTDSMTTNKQSVSKLSISKDVRPL